MRSVIVVGAGCFGAWTAYCLARTGHTVTLVDAYGTANSRASSGGETRIIRMGYGAQEIYTRWSWRSLGLWKSLFERAAAPSLFRETGVLWMAREADPLTTATIATLERVGVPHERLSRAQLESRWPQIDFGPIVWAIHEPASGVLLARRAVEALVREAVRAGVRYAGAVVEPPAFARTSRPASYGAAGPAFARTSRPASELRRGRPRLRSHIAPSELRRGRPRLRSHIAPSELRRGRPRLRSCITPGEQRRGRLCSHVTQGERRWGKPSHRARPHRGRQHAIGGDDWRRHIRLRVWRVAPEALSGSARRPDLPDAPGNRLRRSTGG